MSGRNTNRLTGTWNDIKGMASIENLITQAFFQHLRMLVGEGTRVKFWEDTWIGDSSLQKAFPSLYKVSSQQKEVISNMGWFEGNKWRWVLAWKRVISWKKVMKRHNCIAYYNNTA